MKFSRGVNRDSSLLRPGTSVLLLVLSYHISRCTISHAPENRNLTPPLMISSLLVLRWMKPSKDKPIKFHTLGKSFVHSLTAITALSQFFLMNLKGNSLSSFSRVFFYWTAEHYFLSFWIILLNNSYPNLRSRHTHLFADCSRLCWNVLLCAIPTTKNTECNFQKVAKGGVAL